MTEVFGNSVFDDSFFDDSVFNTSAFCEFASGRFIPMISAILLRKSCLSSSLVYLQISLSLFSPLLHLIFDTRSAIPF